MTSQRHTDPPARRREEQGFSLIEVLVALLMLALVSVAVAGAMSSAGSTQTKSKQRTQQVAMAQGGVERLQSDGQWSRTTVCMNALSPATCTVTTTAFTCRDTPDASGWCLIDLRQDSGTTQTYRARAVSTGYDSAADGTGRGTSDSRDRDGIIPDYFRVTLEVQTPSGTDASGFNAKGTYTLVTDVSPSTRSNTGSVVVRACALVNQVDHRQPVIQCPEPGTMPMFAPVDFEAEWSREDARFDDDLDQGDSIDGIAFSAVDAIRRSLNFRPVAGVRYTLTPITSTGAVDPARPSMNGITNSTGYSVEPYVVAGQYRIDFAGYPNNLAPWNDHSLPGDGFVSVGAGVATHVSQLFQPIPRQLTIRFSHRTSYVTVSLDADGEEQSELIDSVVRLGTENRVYLRLIAAPLERVPVFGVNPVGRILGDGSMIAANVNDESATFTNVAPGLYAAYLIAGKNQTSDFRVSDIRGGRLEAEPQQAFKQSGYKQLDYIWVDASGAVMPGTDGGGDGDPNEIWYNTHETVCTPIPLCGAAGPGPSAGGSAPSGGGGGL